MSFLRSHVTCACLVAVPLLLTGDGCLKKKAVSPVVKANEEDAVMVRHNLEVLSDKDWKAEVWLSTPMLLVDHELYVWVRLTSLNEKEEKLPKVKVHLAMVHAKSRTKWRETELDPHFQDCSKMKKRKEVSHTNGVWGEKTDFPQQQGSWQTIIEDPFPFDPVPGGTKRFEEGEYWLKATVSLEDGSTFRFPDIRVQFVLKWKK